MAQWNGWAGTILDVDLSSRRITKERLSRDLAVKYIGGSGFGARILYDLVGPEIDPLSDKNVLLITNGPLSGTTAPASGRYDIISKSPYTGIYARSNGGGFFGPELKRAGYDLIIIRGKSERPVYLWVNDDDVEIRDASHLWGQDTWVTQQMIQSELKDRQIRTLKIGPAGENLCFSSAVIGDMSRAAGKMSIGAVWGAKKLKAIAVRGSKGVNIARPDQFAKKCIELYERAKKDPLYRTQTIYGTMGWVWDAHAGVAHPGQFPNVTAAIFHKDFYDKKLSCFGCDLGCSHFYTVKKGTYRGTAGPGLEGNVAIFVCGFLGIDDPAFLCKYNNVCNQLGLHVDFPGIAIGWAISLYEKGIITKEDTSGIELRRGDQETVLKLMRMMVNKEGFGEVLDGYPRRSVDKLGKGELYASDVKGVYGRGSGIEFSTLWILAQSVATRGRDHLTGANHITKPNFIPEMTDEIIEKLGRERYGDPKLFFDTFGTSPLHAQAVFDHENICALCDMTGICKFRSEFAMYCEGLHKEDFAELMSLATGVDFTLQDVVAVAEREFCLERAFNAREGIRRIDDYPHAFRWQLEHGEEHPGYDYKKMPLSVKQYDKLLDAYYALRGCDLGTGIPTREKLEDFDLEDVADDLEKRGILPATGQQAAQKVKGKRARQTLASLQPETALEKEE